MGGAVFLPCCLTWGQTIVEVMKIMATSCKRSGQALLHSVPPTLQQATADPHLCWRLLDIHGQVWVSLLWGHWSFLLGPGAHKGFICALQEFVPWVLCKFWWHCGGVNGDLLQEGLCYTQVCCTQSSCCCSRLLLTHTSTGDTQTLKGRSGSVSGGSPGMHKVLSEFSERNGILF